ncbi:MAG: ABC transporter substrate-binding protein [Clostridia bacterium]|nr:ABC transporter substrate-binding protein [Clostridia bacterium]
MLTGALTSTCILFPFSACGEDDGLKTVKINEVTHSVFYAPLYLAEALGYFDEVSIKIELTNGGGADNVMSAVLSGDADVGFCGPEAALYVLIGGSTDAAKVFGQLTQRDGSFLVAREAPDGEFDWAELVGKEVLAGRRGGVPAMTFEYVLKEHGILPQVNLNYDVAFNLMTSAFESGTADYCTMFDPVAYDFEAKGYHVVASVGEASGEIPYTCFMAKESWLEDNETHAQNFLTAVTKAIKYVNETDENTVAEYLKPYFEGTQKEALAASVKRYKAIDAWVTNMAMTESSFNRLQDVIESAGELERRVEFSSLIDVTYANAAYGNVYST